MDDDPRFADPDDVVHHRTPTKPSELTGLSDEELFKTLRKVAYANKWPLDAKVQFEAMARLIAALKWSSRWLIGLTVVLAVLTTVLVSLTLRL